MQRLITQAQSILPLLRTSSSFKHLQRKDLISQLTSSQRVLKIAKFARSLFRRISQLAKLHLIVLPTWTQSGRPVIEEKYESASFICKSFIMLCIAFFVAFFAIRRQHKNNYFCTLNAIPNARLKCSYTSTKTFAVASTFSADLFFISAWFTKAIAQCFSIFQRNWQNMILSGYFF